MKSVISMAALLFASACALPGNWSYAGLNFDAESGEFSGLPETTVAQMPTTGSAVYTGEYRYLTRTNPFGKGSAQLDVDFDTTNVQLALTGTVNATATGNITGVGFSGTSGFDFVGQFYQSDASVAAGYFSNVGAEEGLGQFITQK